MNDPVVAPSHGPGGVADSPDETEAAFWAAWERQGRSGRDTIRQIHAQPLS